MADILTLPQARDALGWTPGQNPDRDSLIESLYIPATTAVVEGMCGRMSDRVERWTTRAAGTITTPWPTATIVSVKVPYCSTLTGWTFSVGVLTLPSFIEGTRVEVVATGLPTPAPVLLAAGIILAQLWNSDKQGRTTGSSVRTDPTSSGYAIPNRARTLLEPYMLPGFA